MKKIIINPCKSCGSDGAYIIKAMSEYRVCCDNKVCRQLGAWRRTRSEAVKAWNDGIYK